MDVFALLFVVSFLVLIFTLVVMHIRKRTKTKGNVIKGSKHIGWVSDVQEKWKLTLPKHSTRIKLRNSRKLRNKRKEKK